MFGGHCIKSYSQRWETIALPPGESKSYGIERARWAWAHKGFLHDMGVDVEVQV